MTYTSCWIEILDEASDTPDPTYLTAGPRLSSLGPFPSKSTYWLPVVQAWAKERGHQIDWIDNSWFRVRITAEQLLDFLDSVLGPDDYRTVELKPQIAAPTRYTVVAEEF